MSPLLAPEREDLINSSYADARQRLRGDVSVHVLVPPYPCAGIGSLRVVRARSVERGTELVLTYADYERLPR